MEKDSSTKAKSKAPKPPKEPSVLEARFMKLWDVLSGAPLEREYRFDPKRRWKADFAQLEARVLIEIEGGVWNRGRHLTPKGFIKDAEKYLAATLQGWTVLRLTTEQLTSEIISLIVEYVRARMPA